MSAAAWVDFPGKCFLSENSSSWPESLGLRSTSRDLSPDPSPVQGGLQSLGAGAPMAVGLFPGWIWGLGAGAQSEEWESLTAPLGSGGQSG